jgi:hypothetical protein
MGWERGPLNAPPLRRRDPGGFFNRIRHDSARPGRFLDQVRTSIPINQRRTFKLRPTQLTISETIIHNSSLRLIRWSNRQGSSPLNCGRWLLTLAYLVASLLAQGVHVHDRGRDRSFLKHRGDCDASRLHIDDREIADHSELPTVCPSCQLKSQASILALTVRPVPGQIVLIPVTRSTPSTLPGSPLRTRCRAPPLA